MAFKFDVNKEVTKALKIKLIPELGNLALATLENVEVVMNEVPTLRADKSENPFEYAGHTVPSLKFTFKNYVRKEDVDKAERWFTHFESIIVSTKNDGVEMDEQVLLNLYEQMWSRIKHIHDAFKDTPNYKPFTELPEINEKAPVEVRIKQFTKFFTAVAEGFNDGKSGKIYEDEKGNKFPLGLKLTAEYGKQRWLEFPTYVGEGFIERFIPGRPFTIEVKPSDIIELKGGKGTAKSTSKADGSDGLEDLDPEVRKMLEQK